MGSSKGGIKRTRDHESGGDSRVHISRKKGDIRG